MIYLYLLLLFNLTSCLSILDIPSGYERIAHQASRKAAKILSKKYHMKQMGLGGGMMGQVNMMYIAFHMNRPLTIKEARQIIIDCAQEYLAIINADEKLRPFLVIYPFGINNIEIDIFTSTSEGYTNFYPLVCSTGLSNGHIRYFKRDPQDEYNLKSEIYETYQEAVDIVNSPYLNSGYYYKKEADGLDELADLDVFKVRKCIGE